MISKIQIVGNSKGKTTSLYKQTSREKKRQGWCSRWNESLKMSTC